MPNLQCLELSLGNWRSPVHPLYLPGIEQIARYKSDDILCTEISNGFQMMASSFQTIGRRLVSLKLLEKKPAVELALNAGCFSKKIWKNLQFLQSIDLSLKYEMRWRNDVASSISFAQNLTDLRLQEFSIENGDDWLKYKWPKLINLSLTECWVDATLLKSFLSNHKTSIRSLHFRGCYATKGSWVDILENSKKCLRLKSAWLDDLTDEDGKWGYQLVSKTSGQHLVEVEEYLVRNGPSPFPNHLIDYKTSYF
ncbi:hypothetical protein B0O99DRAFT_631040 [Bisporella sp. PMI_857]|nr:hypothetical protein B0O99DRAFT_631040 [Bisporella sp. PMI_857]